MKTYLSVSASLALILVCESAAAERQGADWPRFRGPKLNNISPDKGLLKEWPKDGPPVVWKGTGIGSGFSSVAVAGDRVYTLGNKNRTTHLVAIDRQTGKVLWSAVVGPAGGNLGCTPTVDGNRVYAIGQQGDLVCVETAKGEVLWKKNFKKDFGGQCGGWNYTESPLIDGDRLICTPGAADALMVALDKKTGAVIWKCPSPFKESTAGYSSPVVAEVGGIRQYVQLVAGGVVGVAARDGRFLWKYEKLGRNTANIPTPIILGDHVFCAAGYGKGGALLKLTASGDKVTAEEVYYSNKLRNKHGGIVVVGDRVYGDQDDRGYPYCAELKTGKVLWQKKQRGPGEHSAAVTYADGRLYFVYENGVVALVEPNAKEYREVGSFKIPKARGASWAHPVVVGGKLYVRQDDTLWCFDVQKH
jgi:outer membrane protein assembly factor BamB